MIVARYMQESNVSVALRDYIKKYIDSLNGFVDNEDLFIKCASYLDIEFPNLSSYYKARILWNTVILGVIFDF